VQSYLEKLPPREAEVLRLEFLEGLKAAEIAALSGIRRGSARMARSRGLRRLRQIARAEAATLEKISDRNDAESGQGAS